MSTHGKGSQADVLASGKWLAIVAGLGWVWAVTLLGMRHHSVRSYTVISPPAPAWSMIGMSAAGLLLAVGLGVLLAWGAGHVAHVRGVTCPAPSRWLLAAYVIPGLDLLRLAQVAIPCSFLEPILLAFVTGMAVSGIAESVFDQNRLGGLLDRVPWLTTVWLLTIGAALWWTYQGCTAYDNFMLGYIDFGQCAVRVANTWEGRGMLIETPSLPAFWDHFNPGLVLLAPLWGLWSDPRLFIVLQAVCLALPAPFVWGIARRFQADRATAAMWSIAYLVYPAVGQMNLTCSYGWHAVSLALPLLFAALWAFMGRHYLTAGAVLILACSFKETVPMVVACLALALAVHSGLHRRRPDRLDDQTTVSDPLVDRSLWSWFVMAGVMLMGLALITWQTPFSQFQQGKFAHLGGSTWEIVLSPVKRPGAFWGAVFRPRCGYFLLALAVPLGLPTLCRGWPILLALVLPLGALLAMGLDASTSICFQYTTTLIPVLLLATITGAADCRQKLGSSGYASGRAKNLWAASMAAVAAGCVASASFGSLPWSSPTMLMIESQTYSRDNRPADHERIAGSSANDLLQRIVAHVGRRDAGVLATGRVAAHLVGIRRLETVSLAISRWDALDQEAGPGHSPIEVFDWIVIDQLERFQQSVQDVSHIEEEAREAGYILKPEWSKYGILVFERPPR